MRKITVAIAVDDKMGIAFNKRRQSRDKMMIEDLVSSQTGTIYVSDYSKTLFSDFENRIKVVSDPIRDCVDGGCCFIELSGIGDHLSEISSIILYRWNRYYPSDTVLDINFDEFTLISADEFVGFSHEKITREIYKINH